MLGKSDDENAAERKTGRKDVCFLVREKKLLAEHRVTVFGQF